MLNANLIKINKHEFSKLKLNKKLENHEKCLTIPENVDNLMSVDSPLLLERTV